MSLANGYWSRKGQKGCTVIAESNSVELKITELSFFIAEQDSL